MGKTSLGQALRSASTERLRFMQSKVITLCWGVFAIAFSFGVEHIASTLLESINKVSSVVNGPLLGLFVVAVLLPGTKSAIAVTGFAVGIALNLALWQFVPDVSWLWWNLSGCLTTLAIAMLLTGWRVSMELGGSAVRSIEVPVTTRRSLLTGFTVMLSLLIAIQLFS